METIAEKTAVAKKVISSAEFEKRVEIEAQNLMYFEYKDKRQAFDEARQYVSSKFQAE
jgi:hypothetical protein